MENLRRYRKAKGLTMKELGEMVDVSESMIQMVETGKRKPSFELLLKLGEVLECSVDDLVREEQKEPAPQKEDGFVYEPYDVWRERDMRLLRWFRSLPEEKQRAILFAQDAPEDLV